MNRFLGLMLVFCLSISTNAGAVIIDNGSYTTVDGLDWLDLSYTVGRSAEQALLENPEYSLATTDQFWSMWAAFDTRGDDDLFGETASRVIRMGNSELFAVSDSSWFNNPFFYLFDITYSSSSHASRSRGALGLVQDENEHQTLAGLLVADGSISDLAYISDMFYRNCVDDSMYGSFLVRAHDSQTPPSGVPEPSVLLLLGAGILGMGMTRRRKVVR